jgi:epoxyqueuosine reductase
MAGNSAWIVEGAKTIGFDLCGVVRAEKFAELEQFGEWLKRGYAGEMRYLDDPRRLDLSLAMQDVRSVIVCALNYNTEHPYSTEAAGSVSGSNDEPSGWISRYAWGDDYHEVMWSKLNALTVALKEKFPQPFNARAYADTGPVAERVLAKHAGLGWLGKNTLLLNEKLGSWLFLGVILTSLDLEPSVGPAESPPPDLCGNCRQCLDACPTGALVEPYMLDARRCISYLTIELRGEIPGEFRDAMGWQVYGCDLCQDVCPYNRVAPATNLPEFQPRKSSAGERLLTPRLEWLAALSEEEFREQFRGSAAKRTKWAGLVRNACIALGNTQVEPGNATLERIVALLERLSDSTSTTIAESARWAISRIKQKRD